MSMTGGAVTIDGSGNASGGGLARAMYDALLPTIAGVPSGAAGVAAKTQIASLGNALGPAIVAYIQANAAVTVNISTSASGLQRVGGVDTEAPGAAKTLPGTVG